MNNQTAEILTQIMLAVFRTNGSLLEAGDKLVKPLQLTSARWQVIGAIAISGLPLTVPEIAIAMGLTRQGVQKQINALMTVGLLEQIQNPSHKRSSLYSLSEQGVKVYAEVNDLHERWVNQLSEGLPIDDLQVTLNTLEIMHRRLKSNFEN